MVRQRELRPVATEEIRQRVRHAPVPSPLPGWWSTNLFVAQAGILPSTADFTDTWSVVAPAGHAGTTVLVQACALTPLARNGLFETTAAHRFVRQ
jgi:hypothetical protein